MYCVVTDIGGRSYMEDTHIIRENLLHKLDLYCVFDGHGGDFVSNYLRDNYENILKEKIRENRFTITDVLVRSLQEVIKKIPKEQAFTCGSTCLVALKYGEVIFIANAGDCRAIMNDDLNVMPITVDHKPNLKREYDRILALEGGHVTFHPLDVPRVNGNLAVSRSVGDFYLHPWVTWVPDIYVVKVNNNNNIVILASDGIWDTMSNYDVNKIFIDNIVKNDNTITKDVLNTASHECLREARRKGSTDNITLLVFVV